MAKVDIGAEEYDSFADVDFADVYLLADPLAAPLWAELSGQPGLAEKGRLLVTATRVIKRQDWKNGVPSFDATPDNVKEATVELAAALLQGFDLSVPAASILPVKRQKAGGVEIEYFRNLDSPAYQPPPLPPAVWDLLKPLLKGESGGGGFLAGSYSAGTYGRSITEACEGVDERTYFGFGSGSRDYSG